jgi:hypothetical protein
VSQITAGLPDPAYILWTMKALRAVALLSMCSLSAAALVACGGDDDGPGPADADNTTPDAGSTPDGAPGDWSALITGDWSLEMGTENWLDFQHTIPSDTYITAIRPIDPPGTHHTLLTIGAAMDGNVIYASGVGTGELVFPEGVGLKLTAGTVINLQLHLFNIGETTLTGTSGVEVITAAAADVVNEADIFLPGPFNLSIAPMTSTTQAGTCTVAASYSVFALFPHMHQMGTHFKTTLHTGGSDMVLHDADYSFYEQAFTSFTPIPLSAGDTITTECTWDNPTASPVGWGNSSTQEMCFSILFRYPAQNDSEFCIN